MPRIEGILLAAGESRRMGYPKPLLRIGGQSFVEHTATLMLAVVPRLTIVVGGNADRVRLAIPADPRIVTLDNPRYLSGQFSSLKAAIASLSTDVEAALVHLADHPVVRQATFERVIDTFSTGHRPIVIARHDGKRGHPVLFAHSLFDELLNGPEDQGARAIVNRDPSRVQYVEVDDPGVTLDLDTPTDLAKAGLPPPYKSRT